MRREGRNPSLPEPRPERQGGAHGPEAWASFHVWCFLYLYISQIIKIVAVMPDGKAGMPCGACREFMMQLNKTAGEIEILCDYETKKVIHLKSLTPEWWSTDQMEMNE